MSATALTLFAALLTLQAPASAQTTFSRDQLLEVSREIMESARTVALITVGEDGAPRVRAMDPNGPDEDMVVWLATNPATRKVEQIRRDPRVTLYYYQPSLPGYVTISGTARLVDDPTEKERRWNERWAPFYPNRTDAVLLIEVVPNWLEVVAPSRGILGPDSNWRPPRVEFGGGAD